MKYSMQFGTVTRPAPKGAAGGTKFRLAVLGDFSGRANSGQLATGAELAKRKPLRVDVDNLDDVLRKLNIKLQLPVGAEGGMVQVPIGSVDDFHPDQLYDNLEIFSHLSSLRKRLNTSSMFAKAAQEMQSWPAVGADKPALAAPTARGSSVPVGGKLSDFARLVGKSTTESVQTPVDALLKQIIGPHIVPTKDPKQPALVQVVDEALSETMCSVLHHPDFQTLEATWRGVDLLTRRMETSDTLEIVLYDITAEELAADLSQTTSLEETGLYKLLVEQPALDAQQGALSVLVGNYQFEQTPPHAELLGRMAKIAAAAQAPFIASIGTECLKKVAAADVHPLIQESWSALRALPEAAYLGLAVPRFMLRNPYGDRTESIDKFEFEEFSPQRGIRGMLWGNPAILAGLLLGQTFQKQGMKKMNLGSVLGVGDMPYYFYEDADGDQTALPCTERLVTVSVAEWLTYQRFIPLLAIKGRNEVRLGGFQSLAGKTLAGPWGVVAVPLDTAKPVAKAPQPAATGAEAAASANAELDALLGNLDAAAAPAAPAAAPAEAPAASADAELDALLASLGTDQPAEAAGSTEMDAGLAALLADL